MTRRLPPKDLEAARTPAKPSPALPERVAADLLKGYPPHQVQAALAALYERRPDLGAADPDAWHVHALLWPRHDAYFGAVCRLLKWFGVGTQWGLD